MLVFGGAPLPNTAVGLESIAVLKLIENWRAASLPSESREIGTTTVPPGDPMAEITRTTRAVAGVGVAVGVLVGVAVPTGVAVGVAVGVLVGVAVATGVDVGVAVGVLVGVDVGVAVGVLVGVAVGVAVGVLVGVGVPAPQLPLFRMIENALT